MLNCSLDVERKLVSTGLRSKYNQVRWFLTGDNEEVLERVISDQPAGRVILGLGKIDHVEGEPEAYTRAIIDLELLSYCDELILTGGSTYGFLSALKAAKLPLYVNGHSDEMKRCERMNFRNLTWAYHGYSVFK